MLVTKQICTFLTLFSCGEVYSISGEIPPAGSLGTLMVDHMGTRGLHKMSEFIQVSHVIGRSIVVSSRSGKRLLYKVVILCILIVCVIFRLMCGVIARSAGLFQNSKRICTCDGISIWDEAKRKQFQ